MPQDRISSGKTTAYFHLPGLFEFYELYKRFLPLFFEHREYFYEWCGIGSIYGAPAGCIWGGGRVGEGDQDPGEVLALLEKYGAVCPEALVESAFGHIRLLNQFDFDDICVSLKSSSVPITMAAYRLMSERSDYPLHLGVTEAGTRTMGTIKSAIGIGGLLAQGIGDTFRVTLTADPVEEIVVARQILQAAGLRQDGPNLIACPTCGRTRIDLIPLAQEVERRLKDVQKPITVAVMGCVVNGPGEASAADVGIAGGNGFGFLFAHGQVLKKVPEDQLVDQLFALIETL